LREISFLEAIREALSEEMKRDERVFLLGEDIGVLGGAFGQTKGFIGQFGEERIRDTPISESAIIGAAVGSSLLGMRPVAEIMFNDFSTLAMDQIINQAAKMRFLSGGQVTVPIVIRMQGGAGKRKAAQHSQSFESIFAHIPGLKVVMPSTPYDAKGLLKTSIRDNNPVIFIEHGSLYGMRGPVPEEDYSVSLGVSDIKKEGKDISIVTYSFMVHKVLNAAQQLGAEGINAEVIDLRTLRPLDIDTVIRSIKKTHRAVVAHEACITGGFGGEILSRIVEEGFDYLDAPLKRVGLPDVPVPYAKLMEDLIVPTEVTITKAVKEVMGKVG
jgi:pyruvate/2-oxoglutarate/acetoin dehydrogenase E1 component